MWGYGVGGEKSNREGAASPCSPLYIPTFIHLFISFSFSDFGKSLFEAVPLTEPSVYLYKAEQ